MTGRSELRLGSLNTSSVATHSLLVDYSFFRTPALAITVTLGRASRTRNSLAPLARRKYDHVLSHLVHQSAFIDQCCNIFLYGHVTLSKGGSLGA